jgi:YVTN family beta-propeller protein
MLVLDRGPGKETVRFGYHPTGRSSITVVDPATLQEVGRADDLCWNLQPRSWLRPSAAPDGAAPRTLLLACTGYRSQKPQEDLAREVISLDFDTGRVTARAEIPRAIDAFVELPDGTAVVFSAREAPKDKPALPAQLRFLERTRLEVQQTVSLDGDPGPPLRSPDGEYLYLLEFGKPDKKPEKNVNGRVQVVSLARRAHETNLEAGRAPRGLVLDEEGRQVLLLSEGSPSVEKKDERPGELRVIRGADIAATVEVGSDPRFLRIPAGRERLHVVSAKAVTTFDLAALSAPGSSGLKPEGVSPLSADAGEQDATELEVSADQRRGYVLYAESSKLGILDLEAHKFAAEINTGRGGVKFGKMLAAVAASAASYSAGYSAASASGGGMFFYTVYGVAPANTSLALSTDEKFLYVLNTKSNDVTIVDTATRTAVNKIGVGGAANRLELLPGGAFVAVTTGADTLHLIDTRTNTKTAELPDGGNYRHSPDLRHAAAIGKGVVYCLDGPTLKTLGRASGFKSPVQILFEQPAEPR